MKKTIAYTMICAVALLMCGTGFYSYAADSTKISAAYERVEQVDEQSYIVPIYIVNNPGIMGFRIDITYDYKEIKINTISKGKITSEGNFNTNISTAGNSGSISIWWNATDNVQGDGSVMYVNACVINDECNSLDLNISYSQDDTFNAEWEDVVLDCYSVSYPIKDGIESSQYDSEDIDTGDDVTTTKETEIKNDNATLPDKSDNGTELPGIIYKKYQEGIVPENVISDDDEHLYQENADKSARSVAELDDIGEDKLKGSIARKMKEYNIKDVQDLDDEKKYEFWNAVDDDLINIEGVSEKKLADIDIAKIAETVIVSDEDIEAADLSIKPKIKENKNKSIVIWIEAAVIVFIFAAVLVIRRRRK